MKLTLPLAALLLAPLAALHASDPILIAEKRLAALSESR